MDNGDRPNIGCTLMLLFYATFCLLVTGAFYLLTLFTAGLGG